jgi:hypothetical protein
MTSLKKYSFTQLVVFVLFCVSGYSQKLTDAYSYINYINNEYSKVMEDMWSYTSAVAHGKNARKIESKRNELIRTTLQIKENISKMPAFQDDQSLRDSTVIYLGLGYSILINDYSKIVDMEAVAEQSYDQMEAYILAQEKANEKLDLAGKRLEKEQIEFALKHHITLVEGKDKIGNNLEKANQAFGYYNKVYLLFFKCHKQDIYLSDALNKSDVNAVEQNKNALLKFSDEGLKQLNTLKSFSGDNTLKTSCSQLLDFYRSEATVKIPILINFFLKKEAFDKTKAAFDAKSQMERTKADVEQYNKTLNDYNKSIVEFNNTNIELTKKNEKLVNAWNQTVQVFLDKHVPKK